MNCNIFSITPVPHRRLCKWTFLKRFEVTKANGLVGELGIYQFRANTVCAESDFQTGYE